MSRASEAMEMQVATMRQLVEFKLEPQLRRPANPAEVQQWSTDIAALHRATPFYWGRSTTQIVAKLMLDFDLNEIIATRHLVYCDVGWMWFGEEAPFQIELNTELGPKMGPCKAITWYVFGKEQPFLGLTAWAPVAYHLIDGEVAWTDVPCPALWSSTLLGAPLSSSLEGDDVVFKGRDDSRTRQEIEWMKQFVAAASTFVRQKLFLVQEEKIERHARKRLQRLGAQKMSPVQVIHLRQRASSSERNAEPSTVDWQVQWSVKGHTRSQWYPSLQEHLPVYIHPYVKGPEDKPMKARTTPLFEVTR